jgi:hypothetical protein
MIYFSTDLHLNTYVTHTFKRNANILKKSLRKINITFQFLIFIQEKTKKHRRFRPNLKLPDISNSVVVRKVKKEYLKMG